MNYSFTCLVTRSTLLPFAVLVYSLLVLVYLLVLLVYLLAALAYLLVAPVCPFVCLLAVLICLLVVSVCPLVVLVWSFFGPLVVLVVPSASLFITDPQTHKIYTT